MIPTTWPDLPAVRRLSPIARACAIHVELRLGAAGIGTFYPETLPRLSGFSRDECDAAWRELLAAGPDGDAFVEYDEATSTAWIPAHLDREPAISYENPRHRTGLRNHIDALVESPLVERFRERNAAWWTDPEPTPGPDDGETATPPAAAPVEVAAPAAAREPMDRLSDSLSVANGKGTDSQYNTIQNDTLREEIKARTSPDGDERVSRVRSPEPERSGAHDARRRRAADRPSTPKFEAAWAAFPHRPKDNKRAALRAWWARRDERVPEDRMLAGALAEAKLVAVDEIERQFVKMAATFFGPTRPFDASLAELRGRLVAAGGDATKLVPAPGSPADRRLKREREQAERDRKRGVLPITRTIRRATEADVANW